MTLRYSYKNMRFFIGVGGTFMEYYDNNGILQYTNTPHPINTIEELEEIVKLNF